jgi:peptide chain release factor 1
MLERIAEIEARFEELTALLGDPEVASDHRRMTEIARERAQLERVVDLGRRFRDTSEALDDARDLLRSGDEDERELAREEEDRLSPLLAELEDDVKVALLPRDPADEKDAIIEIRGGAGGDEAALFAADLFRMYQRYAERQGWKLDVLNTSESGPGGYREITFEVSGQDAYRRMKHESGVHRVQRVPETESQGRIHTSTATVAVLPEVDEVEVDIDWSEVRTDIFHASSAGGQNVNKVATAVRFTHEPTGIVVICQDERSQAKNRAKAESVLRARLYELERSKADAEIADARRTQVGTGDRSEKIRTYNFPQDRVTDHRVNITLHSLPRILDGEIEPLIDAVQLEEQSRLLAAATG